MSRLYRTIVRLQSGQKIDEERMLDILSRLADDALRYSDDDERLADIPARDIEDALDWAISRIEGLEEDLDLLKEQEPRVLEFMEISETTTYWMEDNHEANRKTTCIPETIMDIMGDRVVTIPVVKLINGYAPVISKNREGYGKTWRAWTSRPTPEQMRETKWEDSNKEGEVV